MARARVARDSAEFAGNALDILTGMIGCEGSVFTDHASEQPITTLGVDSAQLPLIEYCEQNFASYAPEVGTIVAAAQRLRGIVDHDVVSLSQRRRSSFYSEIVRPQRIESMLVLIPHWRGQPTGMLRLQRGPGGRFQERDVERALQLLPAFEVSLAALRYRAPAWRATLPRLSARESEIAVHVSRGLTTPQIASLLGSSKLTVRNQIGRIFDKLGLASRAELAAWVARQPPGKN